MFDIDQYQYWAIINSNLKYVDLSNSLTVQAIVIRRMALSHINVGSIQNEIPQFHHYICDEDLCAVTETWLKYNNYIIMKCIQPENF